MLKLSHWRRIAALCLTLLLAACGGGDNGSSAAPPAGFTVTPGNGSATISWTSSPGVQYWLMYAAGSGPLDIKNPPGGHLWATDISSPYVISGLTNGASYSFAMNSRIGGGPGGAQTASLSVIPRTAGSTWVAGTSALGTMRGVAFGTASDSTVNYVAVGAAGAIYKGLEGVSQGLTGMVWNTVTPVAGINFNAATYAFSKFIAVGANGSNNIYTSADMSTWTAAATSITTPLNAIASNGTTVLAVGDSGTIFSSTDGSNWTARTPITGTPNLYGVTYSAAGYWIVVGANGVIATSTDLATWTTRYNTGPTLRGVTASSANVFVAVGDGGSFVKSADALTWTAQTAFTAANLNAVSTDSVQFITVGQGGAIFTSADGITWVAATSSSNTSDLMAVVGSASKYVAVGSAGANISSTH
jgi:hypothetical protein